jgi:hypothetical protein
MADIKQYSGIKKQRDSFIITLVLAAVFSMTIAACSDTQPLNGISDNDLDISAEAYGKGLNNLTIETNESLLRELRRATARFHSTEQATKAEYAVASHCVVAANPELGAMGYHWVNQSLVDPVFEISKPEAVLYEPDKNGNLKLVAAEYIVINIGQPRPYFGDYPFDIGGTPIPVPHWSLHVWLWKDNPNGIFTNYNPNVKCPD